MIIMKLFISLIVLVAVVVGILNITPFHPDVVRLAMFSEFFSASLPILAFGALVKYLCSCSRSCSCGCSSSKACCCGKGLECKSRVIS